MGNFESALSAMDKLFKRDFPMALATAQGDVPSLREVDTYWDGNAFWVVTYRKSRKVCDILVNPNVALCNGLYSFSGKAHDAGHPLDPANSEIRATLIVAYAPWYFKHNDENDPNMCYVRIVPTSGFFYGEGNGYRVNFEAHTAESFAFNPDIV